ncbi:MAG TPA: NFACT family protein [Chloroflexota bacterium]|jgi:predicted ribosome quality control (RQC) complex YloA/Tae2 family protein|nr:NFACT family protein [Chloroflexota bacterium]
MSFDALTLAAVREELEPMLRGSRIQRVAFPDELSVAFECFAPGVGRTNVLCSAHPEHGRVQALQELPARGVETDTPFELVVRKHLRNARIASLGQPRLERVLELDCEQRDASGQPYRVRLIVEAMGRRSNLVLVGADGTILDAARRAPPSRNPRRPVLPHLRYDPPPPQDRLLPEHLSGERLRELWLAGHADDLPAGDVRELAAFLGQRVAGLSPLAARELAFRSAFGDWSRVLQALQELLETREPTVAVREEQHVFEYAPYPLTHLQATGARLERFPSMSAAMDVYYASEWHVPRGDALAGERRGLVERLKRQSTTVERRIIALEHQLATSTEQQEPLRRAGELILTHQPALGSAELLVDGNAIALDPTLSASENAQAYFARYRKAREALARVPQLLTEARNQAEHLADLRTLVDVAPDMSAIRALRREAGVERAAGKKQSPTKSAPYRRVPLDAGWEVVIGTSAAGNSAVTFDLASADDLWLHARGVPGAHVILRGGAGQAPDATVERAAELAAWHSATRDAERVEVDIALRRYVKKIPNAPPGLVRYSNERTVRVTPRA